MVRRRRILQNNINLPLLCVNKQKSDLNEKKKTRLRVDSDRETFEPGVLIYRSRIILRTAPKERATATANGYELSNYIQWTVYSPEEQTQESNCFRVIIRVSFRIR